MKKLFLITIVLFLVCALKAQTTYAVPTPTLEEKFNMTKGVRNNMILALITVAKDEGMTVEEFGKKCGAVFIPVWDENGGFEQFLNFILYDWACSADNVRIVEQSNDKLIVQISSMYQLMEERDVLFGSSVEDFTAFNNALLNEIAVHYDRSIKMTKEEEGYKVVISL